MSTIRERSDSRHRDVLDHAARLFAERGFAAASMRDIAAAVGMLPGSLYYHFPSKEDLLAAVYEEGVELILGEVGIAAPVTPGKAWEHLEAACAAHLEVMLTQSDYAQVVIRVLPGDVPGAAERLVGLRDRYEKFWKDVVQSLPLAPGVDRWAFRLLLLGGLNWATVWYRPGGDSPKQIATKFVNMLRDGAEARGSLNG